MKIAIFDTSVGSLNAGDSIIMESVRFEIESIFPKFMEICIPTQSKISRLAYIALSTSKHSFVGGTNLLSSHMLFKSQWKLDIIDAFNIDNVLLLGVGWWQYQAAPDAYTKFILQKVLHKDLLHSVRDTHTLNMLKSIGIGNILNTGCPTMWNLDEEHCKEIPNTKSEEVVFTLTDYNKDHRRDIELLTTLQRNYKRLYFWPQGTEDYRYVQELGWIDKVNTIPEGLKSFDELIRNNENSLDYVGTRLHGGIRALQRKRRTIIIGIDNRATEKSKDFNLMVIPRSNMFDLENTIRSSFETRINVPSESIKRWKSQFL